MIPSPAFIVLSAGKTFQHPTHRPNELWQTDFTYLLGRRLGLVLPVHGAGCLLALHHRVDAPDLDARR